MCFLTAGPWNTMSRSSGVKLVKRHIGAHAHLANHLLHQIPHERTQGSTAPSLIVFDSSGTRLASSTSRITPVPPQSWDEHRRC